MILIDMATTCDICAKKLAGRQRKYCSRRCKNADTNSRFQSYQAQQSRGLRRKHEAMMVAGGCCSRCGYAKNLAALTWHHRDPGKKAFELDLRSLSNRSEKAIQDELKKCELLCANCHAEIHFPHMELVEAKKSPPMMTDQACSGF